MFALDKQFNLKEKIGNRGSGPGEFIGCSHFHIENDTIYAINEMKQAIEVFVNGAYISHIPYPAEARLTSLTRFFVNEQFIFHSFVSDSLQAVLFDSCCV
jgi:hypothetical protein